MGIHEAMHDPGSTKVSFRFLRVFASAVDIDLDHCEEVFHRENDGRENDLERLLRFSCADISCLEDFVLFQL